MTKPVDPIARIIGHVRSARYEDLPERVVAVAKKAIVDTVGAGIAGSSAPMGKLVAELAREHGGRPDSTLWVYGDKVPAALATVEALGRRVTGKELITAIAVGGDLIPRIRVAAGQAGRIGWEGPTVAPFGVAAAVGKLLGFDDDVMANAMGAAYAHCSGTVLSASDGTWDVWLNAGMAARAGMIAAELARRGHQGAKSPLLGGAGLYPLYFRNEYHEDALLADLGKEFESANVSIKPYSSCKCTHHAIYTTLELMKAHGIRAEQIDRIAVRTCTYNMWLVGANENGEPKHTPRTVNEAQFSMPFTIALAACKGAVFPDTLNEATLNDPAVLALSRKVSMTVTAEKDELAKREGYPPDDVDIHLADGRIYRGCERHVKGHPENPMTFEEVVEKFLRCATLSARRLSAGRLDEFVSRVKRLEDAEDVGRLVRSLT